MGEHEPARPQVQPSQEQIRATRETLERMGVPADATPPIHPDTDSQRPDTELTQADVQPSAVITSALRPTPNNTGLVNEPRNNHDSGADVLPH